MWEKNSFARKKNYQFDLELTNSEMKDLVYLVYKYSDVDSSNSEQTTKGE